MNKKILYGILLLSLFLLSTASMVRPAYGYSFGVPKQAVGMTTEGEVKIFDEDAVEEHLGAGVDLEGLHAGDSDVVGAKSKSHILELKTDEEIDYLNDYVAEPADIPKSHDDVRALLQSLADVNGTAGGLYPPGSAYGPYGSLAWLANYSTYVVSQMNLGGLEAIAAASQAEASAAQLACFIALGSYASIIGQFSKDYDGAVLVRDKWDFEKDEFKENPDEEEDEVPFFADPRDWNEVAEYLQAYQYYIGNAIDSIQAHWSDTNPLSPGWWVTLAGGCAQYVPTQGAAAFTPYVLINNTIFGQLNKISNPVLKITLITLMNTSSDIALLLGYPSGFGAGIAIYKEDYVLGLVGFVETVLETIYAQFHALIPDQGGFLLGQLIAGQPAMVPQGDFITKVVKEYNLKDDVLYDMYGFEYGEDLDGDLEISGVPVGAKSRFFGLDLGGETVYPKAYIDYKVEGTNFIAEIEWPDDMIDPADLAIFGGDNEDELDDFEIEFPYGDTGTQGTVSYKDGSEIIWQMGGVESIPGYEITIILGVSAVSMLGIIYILMRKRKM